MGRIGDGFSQTAFVSTSTHALHASNSGFAAPAGNTYSPANAILP
jgi:hypothetical protein